MPPLRVVDRPALVQAKRTTSVSSSAFRVSGALPSCSSFQTAEPPKISPAPVVSMTLIPLQGGDLAGGDGVLEEAAVGAAGDEDQLHAEGVQNVLCALLDAQTEEELHLFVADLDHIGLTQAPDTIGNARQ